MKKIKLITSTGSVNFEKDLSEWISENQNKEIISISHSSVELTIPMGSKTLKGYEFTAVILYNESTPVKHPRSSYAG